MTHPRYPHLLEPITLGAGKRLFSDADRAKQNLRLRETEAYSNGIIKAVYTVRHTAAS